MRVFVVGGAVRDILLDAAPNDWDYLVEGATESEFLEVYPGAVQVGKKFPVYLYQGEEYAFCRVEYKNGAGHKGFDVEVAGISVEEDLYRRDLTVNSIAMCPETGEMIAHPKSFVDISEKVLRHTGKAFADDPLRVFRVARIACQKPDFSIAPETIEVMRSMKDTLGTLSAERVFIEMKKALETEYSSKFFMVLKEVDCLGTWFPEVQALIGVLAGPDSGKHKGEVDTFHHTMLVLQRIQGGALERYCGLCHDFGKALSKAPPKHPTHDRDGVSLSEALSERLRVPIKWKKAAALFTLEHIRMHRIKEMRAGKAVRLLLKAHKGMPDGISSFMQCAIGDGSTEAFKDDVVRASELVHKVRLPKKYYGCGESNAEVLLNLRAHALKRNGGI